MFLREPTRYNGSAISSIQLATDVTYVDELLNSLEAGRIRFIVNKTTAIAFYFHYDA